MKPAAMEATTEATAHAGRRHRRRENADCCDSENNSYAFPDRVHFSPPNC
jgi:hypothetical protein